MNKSINKLNIQCLTKVQIAKYIKECSTFLAIKEMQIKTAFRFHLTTVRMGSKSRTQTTNAGKIAGERNLYTLLVGM
jgi:hypothetical protein